MSELLITKSVTDKTQADGDQTIDVSDTYVLNRGEIKDGDYYDITKTNAQWQAHFEIRLAADDTAHTPSAGTATIYGVPRGGTTTGKITLAEIDLTSTATLGLMDGWTGIYDSIIISPSSLDADCEYDCIISVWNPQNVLTEYTADTPAFGPKGLWADGAGTNLVEDSRDLTTANWTNSNVDSVARDAVGLDGKENTACTLTDTDFGYMGVGSYTIADDNATHVALFHLTPQFDNVTITSALPLLSTGDLKFAIDGTELAITDGTNTATVAHGGFDAGDELWLIGQADASTSKLRAGIIGDSSVTWGSEAAYTGGMNPGENLLIFEDNEEYAQFSEIQIYDAILTENEILGLKT